MHIADQIWRACQLQVAVQEMRRLQKYGVTPGELDRYKTALLRDSEQLAQQSGSVPSVDTLDFVMESLALGHTIMDQREVAPPPYTLGRRQLSPAFVAESWRNVTLPPFTGISVPALQLGRAAPCKDEAMMRIDRGEMVRGLQYARIQCKPSDTNFIDRIEHHSGPVLNDTELLSRAGSVL